ncbi:hypothetical protein CAPTEDRAFT_104810 [Capitella teleta]|uniref:Ig-like domain-containing protein n=1 Tax=Capitella teleta TaxID=283909 RepID=R7UW79_CAPTE|nr:hypothetical protein CAPTEDRAFT_104810 [Capitella teleta]|eukprot:ELU10579.1 hypothetical protein CAPTEDRAFT_104810 [Capitella teleta]
MFSVLCLIINVITTFAENAQITVPPSNQKGSTNLRLKCSFVGFPKPVVSWYKDGTLLNLSTVYTIMTLFKNGSLLIKYGTAVDTGQYTCVVTNEHSTDSASALVIITGDPKIINQVKSIPAIQGQDLTINCIAGGSPTPQVIWKLDGEALGNITGKREVFSNGTLKILSVTRNDRATYTCVATNDEGGSAVWHTELLIVEIPQVVISPTSATVVVGDVIEFQCDVIGDPPPKITWSVPSRGTFSKTNVAKGIDVRF